MLEFLSNNWQYLVVAAIGLFEILLLIFKKPTKIDTTKERILSLLPLCIRVAEKLYSLGVQKKSFVIETIKEFLNLDNSYDTFISDSLEKILATPSKK